MFKLDSEKALLDAFRPRDRKQVELSRDVKVPVFVRHYLAWSHPAGGRVYLVFAVPDGLPTGIVFDTNGAGPAVTHMCNWCHCSGLGSTVGLLTARSSSKRSVGVFVCSDLGCQGRLEDEADRAGRSVVPAMGEMIERVGRFAQNGLGIDLYGGR